MDQVSALFRIEKSFTPKTYRIGLILAVLIYGTFGYLDYFAMPSNYRDSWSIRYLVIVPLLSVAYLLSYNQKLFRYRKVTLFLLLIAGQIGILYMIAISVPGDLAYYSYYAGLILVMLWASFIFRINFITTVFIALSTILFYNITAIWVQDILNFPFGSKPWLILLNNNYFLVSAAILAIIGSYLIDRQDQEIKRVHNELLNEKKQLEIAKDRAEESDRLKSAFLANMSHEIRTPLNSIIGFSDLIIDPFYDAEQRNEFTIYIRENGNALLSVINDIMDFSKIEAGQLTIRKNEFSVNRLISGIYHQFLPKTDEKKLELTLSLPDNNEEIIMISDEERLRQILQNLLTNAIKFTESGSIGIGAQRHNDSIVMYVTDTGIGIAAEHHERIFDRFWQVDSSKVRIHGGNGLGLTISRSLAVLLGGELWVSSKEGEGSTFTLSFPAKKK